MIFLLPFEVLSYVGNKRQINKGTAYRFTEYRFYVTRELCQGKEDPTRGLSLSVSLPGLMRTEKSWKMSPDRRREVGTLIRPVCSDSSPSPSTYTGRELAGRLSHDDLVTCIRGDAEGQRVLPTTAGFQISSPSNSQCAKGPHLGPGAPSPVSPYF